MPRFLISNKCYVDLLQYKVLQSFQMYFCLTTSSLNLSQALMSLFVLASKDGWVDIMYDGLDAVGVNQQVNMTNPLT